MDSDMVEYRVYTIGDDGHIVKSTPLICDDDRQAIQKAEEFRRSHAGDLERRTLLDNEH
jgi:hypothetical protein